MSFAQQIITILMCTLATMLTRFLPFAVFSGKSETPKYIQYLGKALPGAIFGMLVVYCLKDVKILEASHGLPEAIAIIATILLHKWKKNVLISMAGGTAVYMLLIHLIFI